MNFIVSRMDIASSERPLSACQRFQLRPTNGGGTHSASMDIQAIIQ